MLIMSCDQGDVQVSVKGTVPDVFADVCTCIYSLHETITKENPIAGEYFEKVLKEAVMDESGEWSVFYRGETTTS